MKANPSTGRRTGQLMEKTQGGSSALIDAVSILASAKTEGETRKLDFLSENLQQQGELQRQELDIERERLAIEREEKYS